MDSPYLVHYPILEFLIRWGGYLLLVAITFSPIIYLFFNKKRLVRWKYLIAVYPISFLIFYILFFHLLDFIDSKIFDKLVKNFWLKQASDFGPTMLFATLPLLWPISTFFLAVRRWWGGYSMGVMLSNIGVAVVMFGLLAIVWVLLFIWQFGRLANSL